MEIAEAEFLESIRITSSVRVDRACNDVAISVRFFEHVPKLGLPIRLLNLVNEEYLARRTIDIVQGFSSGSHLCSLVTSADLGPRLLYQLHPDLSLAVTQLATLVPREAELLVAFLVQVEREPIVNDNRQLLSVYRHLDRVATCLVSLLHQDVVPDPLSELQVSLFWCILRQTGEGCQEVAVGDLALDDIRWVDAVEDEGLAPLVREVVRSTPPVKLLLLDVLPELVTLMLHSIDEQRLRSMRERWIVPGDASLDNVLVRQLPQPRLLVRERRRSLPIS